MISRLQISSILILALIFSIFSIKVYFICTIVFLSLSLYEIYSLRINSKISELWMYYFFFLAISIPVYFQVNLSKFSFILLCCILVDSSGYFFGKLIGGYKPFPSISPNKTISGYFFSYLITFIFAYSFHKAFQISSSYLALKIFLIITVALAGDLVESKFKRIYKIKDTSSILREHGGILDRIDSLIALNLIFIL